MMPKTCLHVSLIDSEGHYDSLYFIGVFNEGLTKDEILDKVNSIFNKQYGVIDSMEWVWDCPNRIIPYNWRKI